MIIVGANVWSNFSYGSCVHYPNRWILNPQSSFLILFEKCKKTTRNNIKVYTNLFYENHLRKTAGIKNKRLHYLDSAFETWNELINGGWIEVKSKFQELT